jgi:predicted RNA-binding Zn ribbon-like protein
VAAFARDAVELLTGPLAARVRQCDGVRCGLVFVDTSRPGRRRWCSMEHCGNRAKLRAYRDRRRRVVV